jgi:hypothetical protein
MKINQIRTVLYFIARILGDISAILSGNIGKRAARRAAGKLTGKGLKRLFK